MAEKRWLLAELHCHSTNSDGKLTPKEIVALYEERGYDILAITDHNFLTEVSSKKMIIIPALEWNYGGITPLQAHLLVYFFEGESLTCMAHPATWPIWKKIPSQVAGHEVINGGMVRRFGPLGKLANKIASRWYGKLYKVRTVGSDAHRKKDYATAKFWIFARPELEDIRQALLAGKVKYQ